MSKYSGKYDVYDSFSGYSNQQLRNTKFYIKDQQIAIRNQRELAPFYPFLVGIHCSNKEGGTVNLSSCSYVDAHEKEILTFYLNELKKQYRNLKRKNQEVTLDSLLTRVSWNDNQYVRALAERVLEDGNNANIDGIVMNGIIPVYRQSLLDDMMAMGYPERVAYEWIYNKGNHQNHSEIHQCLTNDTTLVNTHVKLFSHDDLDGVGCVILGKLAYGDNLDYTLCQNGTVEESVRKHFESDSTYDETHITDISMSHELAYAIENSHKKYFLHDHHKTALHLNDFSWCNVQVNASSEAAWTSERMTCGTELYYNWLVKKGYLGRTRHLDAFVDAVCGYDTWRWVELGEEGKLSEKLNILLSEYDQEKFINWFYCMLKNGPLCISNEDEAIINAYKRREARIVEQKDKELRKIIFKEKVIGVVFADDHINIIGNTLCNRHPELDCVAIVNCGRNSISFRCVNPDMDVSVLAKAFGGGGHRAAAGAPLGEATPIDILQSIFLGECAIWVKG